MKQVNLQTMATLFSNAFSESKCVPMVLVYTSILVYMRLLENLKLTLQTAQAVNDASEIRAQG